MKKIANIKILDIMKTDVVHFDGKAHVFEILSIMENDNINGVPIVDENDKVVGFVVKSDIYRFLRELGHYPQYPVELIMSKDVHSLNQNMSLLEASKLLRKENITAVPIIDDDDKLVGLISLENIVDCFIREYVENN
ncbi:MAG: CBS domain-containing protein [Peptostreptococcaceae bacterium]|nr:CBS domain-containing protein [Peptostreptococcaceae bacterium]